MSNNDMVYDQNMNPVWCNTPESCKKWLRHRVKQNAGIFESSVRIWRDGGYVIVSVVEYLRS
jgi:hypothetical protein